MDLYRSKPGILRRLEPVVDRLAAAGVSPDVVSLAAIPVALFGSACLLASPQVPVLLLGVPLVVIVRLVLNLLDGALARHTGRSHPRGELYNELGDRLAKRKITDKAAKSFERACDFGEADGCHRAALLGRDEEANAALEARACKLGRKSSCKGAEAPAPAEVPKTSTTAEG